ncbi:MAG: hypothetical protein ACI906_004029 [Candidatus Latescibacterota bacterium]|jgi:hypothetical protein
MAGVGSALYRPCNSEYLRMLRIQLVRTREMPPGLGRVDRCAHKPPSDLVTSRLLDLGPPGSQK